MNETAKGTGPGTFETRFKVRSYELDGFGHLNHAVYLNYFEQARFDALSAGGLSLERLAERGWAVHVVRIEVDFRREAMLGQDIVVRTRVVEARTSSMTVQQVALEPAPPVVRAGEGRPDIATRPEAVFAEGKVVLVWIGPDRSPMRIPGEVRDALAVK